MVKIINGKRYDTEKAELVADYWNGYGSDDFNYICEEMYRTQKGFWFLSAKGGALTRYASYQGNMAWSGTEIIPLTNDEARDWLEKHDKTEQLDKWFSADIVDA